MAKTSFRHPGLLQKIYDMIQDGAGRTGCRDGLAGFLNKPNAAESRLTPRQPVFIVLVPSLREGIWELFYTSDMANRSADCML
jgi:hypothetical protein